jgi:hypothetical protein
MPGKKENILLFSSPGNDESVNLSTAVIETPLFSDYNKRVVFSGGLHMIHTIALNPALEYSMQFTEAPRTGGNRPSPGGQV